VQQPPPDRTEDPLPEEQRQADRDEESGNDPCADGDPGEDRDLLDLVCDLGELGLRQLDMGADETLRGLSRRPDLSAEAWRIASGSPCAGRGGIARRGIGLGRRPGVGLRRWLVGAGCGRLRLVQWGGLPCVLLGNRPIIPATAGATGSDGPTSG
jgi:hypothetical protein